MCLLKTPLGTVYIARIFFLQVFSPHVHNMLQFGSGAVSEESTVISSPFFMCVRAMRVLGPAIAPFGLQE